MGHLPFLVPLGGALLILILPQDRGVNLDGPLSWVRRWLYLATMLLTLGVLLGVRARPQVVFQLPFLRGLLPYGENLAWCYDTLARTTSLLMTSALLLTGVGNMGGHQSRAQAVLTLLMLAAVIGMCLSWNLVTLLLMAMLLEVAVMSRSVIRVPEESLPHAKHQTWVNLASLVLLLLALVAGTAEQFGNQPAWYSADGLARDLLVLAALLRMGVYPSPASTKRRWEVYLLSGGVGIYLWLRLALANPIDLPFGEWLVPLSWAAIGITSLLAALAPHYSLAVPWLILNQLAYIVLAPYLAPVTATSLVLLGMVHLVLWIGLLRIDSDLLVSGGHWDRRLRRWAPWPFVVTLFSLAGAPFTLGGQVRWLALQATWQRGWANAVPVLAVLFALASVPALQRLRQDWKRPRRPSTVQPWRLRAAVGAAYVAAAALLVLGVGGSAWARDLLRPYRAIAPVDAAAGTPAWSRTLVLILTGYVVPLLGGTALSRFRRPFAERVTAVFEWLNAPLEIDWLYAAIEWAADKFKHATGALAAAIEGPFYLLWTVLCGLALAFYLLGK
ncbi:MAG: hypothetical protein GX557_02105 [Chloroflexi bacterium]|nr:hypothetical protein [Chloroflexota bacterium]